MDLFESGKKKKKHDNFTETVKKNNTEDTYGEMETKKIDISMWLSTGEQYCPDCHSEASHKEDYWECDICKWSITDEEADYGYGYPTLESTYEEDYWGCYTSDIDEEPECCEACGGPWPECQPGCRLFRD